MEEGVEKEEGVGEEKEEGMEGSALHTGITITFTSPTARPQQSVDAGRAKATAPTVATPTVVVRNACLVCVALRAKVFLISALVVVWCVVRGAWCGMCRVCTNVRCVSCCWDSFSIVYGHYGVCVFVTLSSQGILSTYKRLVMQAWLLGKGKILSQPTFKSVHERQAWLPILGTVERAVIALAQVPAEARRRCANPECALRSKLDTCWWGVVGRMDPIVALAFSIVDASKRFVACEQLQAGTWYVGGCSACLCGTVCSLF